MAINIFQVNSNNFSYNSVQYLKKFHPAIYGDNVRVVGAMDQNFELIPFTNYADWTVDGNSFASASLLAAALSSILYSETIIINPSSSFIKNVNASGLVVNDIISGYKSGINDGGFFIGKVLTLPITQNSHIKFEFRN